MGLVSHRPKRLPVKGQATRKSLGESCFGELWGQKPAWSKVKREWKAASRLCVEVFMGGGSRKLSSSQ